MIEKVTRSKSRSFVRTDIGQETCDISDYHPDLFYVNIYGFYSFTIICIFNIQSVLFNKTFKGPRSMKNDGIITSAKSFNSKNHDNVALNDSNPILKKGYIEV